MLNTSKWTCRELTSLLYSYGVRKAVVCSGSRNTPLTIALSRFRGIECYPEIDERSAAFIGLGIAITSGKPVAIVCTSGTALLNFAPAVAEAYYRGVPLIVVSADRPMRWIDQDDSQTIRQPGALSNFVKASYSFLDNPVGAEERNAVNRQICEGLLTATNQQCGPVHFNVEIDEPISAEEETGDEPVRKIESLGTHDISTAEMRSLGRELAPPRKVLIVGGFGSPSSRLNNAIVKLSRIPNIAVVAEPNSNLHGKDIITAAEPTLATVSDSGRLRPDVVISFGGSLVSRLLKEKLRKWEPAHWSVGCRSKIADTFLSLEKIMNVSPELFFMKLASAMQPWKNSESDYGAIWKNAAERALSLSGEFSDEWSDLTAVRKCVGSLPKDFNLHVSNGMTLRYVFGSPHMEFHRIECNRGVSGIDGSTSTAVGSSAVYDRPTVLITGDMSFQYDLGALASPLVSPKLKIIVVANGEGGIFRNIKTTRSLPEREKMIGMKVSTPYRAVAGGYGFRLFEADSEKLLEECLPAFISVSDSPAMLVMHTAAEKNADVFKRYIRFLSSHKK